MNKNRTKLTEEQFRDVLHCYSGVITWQVKQALEKIINLAYEYGYESGVKDSTCVERDPNIDIFDEDQLDK